MQAIRKRCFIIAFSNSESELQFGVNEITKEDTVRENLVAETSQAHTQSHIVPLTVKTHGTFLNNYDKTSRDDYVEPTNKK